MFYELNGKKVTTLYQSIIRPTLEYASPTRNHGINRTWKN